MNKEVLSLLNEQIWLENSASFFYLKLSKIFNDNNYFGISNFFLEQSNEEREHMLKVFTYIMEQDSEPIVPNFNFLEDEDMEFDIVSLFENSLLSEKKVTSAINKVISKCKEVGDYTTENFLQWFVVEQREEENKFKEILDNLKIIGDNKVGLYELNKSLNPPKTVEE
ncbi:MAG: ferritin [Candidatus Dadabacteria bacterium]|jgi:ferritin|nr:ferritin [Candidatus Dadabacteria bacterium]NIQ17099.1 ferritin [Candidatus Dadabacteria bacterium]